MTPIIIFNQMGDYLTTIESYNEVSARITRAADADKKNYFFVVELTRRTWSICDPQDFCGHAHRAGVYRTKDAAANELLRLWHIGETPHDTNDRYLIFKFKEDNEPIHAFFQFKEDNVPVHALELTNLATSFI